MRKILVSNIPLDNLEKDPGLGSLLSSINFGMDILRLGDDDKVLITPVIPEEIDMITQALRQVSISKKLALDIVEINIPLSAAAEAFGSNSSKKQQQQQQCTVVIRLAHGGRCGARVIKEHIENSCSCDLIDVTLDPCQTDPPIFYAVFGSFHDASLAVTILSGNVIPLPNTNIDTLEMISLFQ